MASDRRSWIASWTTLAWVLSGWVLTLIVRPATYGHVAWDWFSLILLWLFSLALVVWLGLRVVLYLGEKRHLRADGAPILTQRFVRNFLLVGWTVALAFRLVALFEVPNLVSGVPLWTFSAALVAFFVWTRVKRRRTRTVEH
jgi:hypothetical protein